MKGVAVQMPSRSDAVAQPESEEAEELALRARAGCATSYAELSRRYRVRLLHVVRPRLGGRMEDAEDVVQEALLRGWQSIDKYDGRYRFSTWLFTIGLRLASDWRRRLGRRATSALDDVAVAKAGHSVERSLVQRELADNLWSVAARVLPEVQYTALWLRYGEDLSVKEVAHVLGRTTIGVRVLLHRARAALRPSVARLADEESGP